MTAAAVAAERRYIKSNAVLDRYGITVMTLYRWIRDPELSFPKPVVINGVRFFALDELDVFDERRRSLAGNTSSDRLADWRERVFDASRKTGEIAE